MTDRQDPLLLKLLNSLFLLRFRIKVLGVHNLPPGAAVIACNHLGYTDFRFHFQTLKHALRFLGIRDSTPWESLNVLIRVLFKMTLGLVDRLLQPYVVFLEKGKPMPPSKVKRLIELLERDGAYVIIMGEGQVSRGTIRSFFRGVGYFALKTDCPVVPVALTQEKRGILARRVIYRIGTPLPPPDGQLSFRDKSFVYTQRAEQAVGQLLRSDS